MIYLFNNSNNNAKCKYDDKLIFFNNNIVIFLNFKKNENSIFKIIFKLIARIKFIFNNLIFQLI